MDNNLIGRLRKNKEVVILGLIILLGIGLRLYRINVETLWHDEIRIVEASGKSVYSILTNELQRNSPQLYVLLGHFWVQLFGSSEFSVRFLSTLFGVLLIPSIYIASKRIFDNTESALISALIVAISPYQIYYSHVNRPYTLLSFMSLLSVYFLCRSLNENKRSLWILYISMTSLCTYTHNYGLFLFPIGYIYLLLIKENNRFALLKRLLFSQGVISLLYILWVTTLDFQTIEKGVTYFVTKPSIFVILGSLKSFSSFCAANINTFIKFLTLASMFFIFKGVFTNPIKNHVSFVIDRGVKEYFKTIAKYSISSNRILLLEYLFSPLISAYLFSILIQPAYLVGRYDCVSYPAFCLLVGSGIASIKNRLGRMLITAGIVILTCNPLYNYYYNTFKSHESRGIVSFVKELSLKDRTTMIVTPAFSFTELRYYFEKNSLNIDVQEFYPRNEGGAVAMIKNIMDSREKHNEPVQFLTHYDNGSNSEILENEVIKYFYPVKEKWFNRGAMRVVYYEELPPDYYVLNDNTINFRDKSQRKYLINGWFTAEEWGTWSEGGKSVILVNFTPTLPSPSKGEDIGGGKDYTMLIKATGFSVPGKQQSVKIYLDDNLLGEHTFTQPTTYFEDIEVKIPSAYIKEGSQRIRFIYSFIGSPAEYGMGPDVRQLAMGVSSIEFK